MCRGANELRQRVCGDAVSYTVNRNINYTNVCVYKCQFCAFSKGKVRNAVLRISHSRPKSREAPAAGADRNLHRHSMPDICRRCLQAHEDLRGAPYLLPLEEVARRTAEAWDRGATEVCMQVHGACSPTGSQVLYQHPNV